jgi:predicted RNase H-like HicB family nuclease
MQYFYGGKFEKTNRFLIMKTRALIEKTKDGGYSIFTPDIDHTIIGVGATVEVAKRDFENSVAEMQAAYTERGLALPLELQVVDFEFQRSAFSLPRPARSRLSSSRAKRSKAIQ